MLLELRQSADDSAGLVHCGADVSLLSQYAAEEEVGWLPGGCVGLLRRSVPALMLLFHLAIHFPQSPVLRVTASALVV